MKESPNQKQDKDNFKFTKGHRRLLYGFVFLIATSAIGPAFLTQTAAFTVEFYASLAFAILISILTDTGAQINIWRVLVVTGLRGQEASNKVLPGLGILISILIAFRGLAFNIGNIVGAGLGLNAMFGPDVKWEVATTIIFAILVLVSKSGQKIMGIVSMILGVIMILVVAHVMVVSNPPYGDALIHSVAPEHPIRLILSIITSAGGIVGGHITFAGAYRIFDSGMRGKEFLPLVSRSATAGILTTDIMRTLSFLAVLGVVVTGVILNADNSPTSVFEHAIGPIGKNIFGVVIFAVAMSSVIGSVYTSATFLKTLYKSLFNKNNLIVIIFIVISIIIFLLIGKSVSSLIIAGAINGWILSITLGAVLVTSKEKLIVGDYKHPTRMPVSGTVTVVVIIIAGILSLQDLATSWKG